jgi:hypothetical protein
MLPLLLFLYGRPALAVGNVAIRNNSRQRSDRPANDLAGLSYFDSPS